MKARIHITLKQGVLDPQGKAVKNSLVALGFEGVKNVRQGKLLELDLECIDPEEAEKTIKKMCQQLLANTVIENFHIEILG